MRNDPVVKDELEAAIEARKEMGAEMEPAVIDAFVARIEQRLVERVAQDELALKRRRDHQKEMVLGSMAISVPLFAIAAVFSGLPGIVAVLVALRRHGRQLDQAGRQSVPGAPQGPRPPARSRTPYSASPAPGAMCVGAARTTPVCPAGSLPWRAASRKKL